MSDRARSASHASPGTGTAGPSPAAASSSGPAVVHAAASTSSSASAGGLGRGGHGGAQGADAGASHSPAASGSGSGAHTTTTSSSSRPVKRARVTDTERASAAEDQDKDKKPDILTIDKNAAVLPSCTECKRRKVKCDRKTPCSACVRRGAPETCQWSWNDNQIDPVVLFSKFTTEIDHLKDRLFEVESFIASLPIDIVQTLAASSIETLSSASLSKSSSKGEGKGKALTSASASAAIAETAALPSSFTSEKSPPALGATPIIAAATSIVHPSTSSSTIFPSPGGPNSVPFPTMSTSSHARDGPSTFKEPFNPRPVQSRPSTSSQEVEYDSAAENAAAYLESFANQRPRGEDSDTPITPMNNTDALPSSPDVSWQEMELTEALTSIKVLPPRLQPQDVHLSWFPLGVDGSPHTPSRSQTIRDIFSYIPTAKQTEYLVGLFEEKVHWRFRVLHMPAFRAEVKRMWEMCASGRQLEIDPLWLGVLFMVLALALSSRPAAPEASGDPFQGLTLEQMGALATGYHASSLMALRVGDCMGKPRPRTVQAVVLFAVYFQQFLQPAAGPSSAERMLHWLAIAIRTAQMMGLHVLGNNPETMPPDDPAWPPGKNALKRQLGLRLWMNLQWADWMSATSSARSYSIHPSYCTSQLVDNLNDWEISPTDWKIDPHPPEVITSTAFEVAVWHVANLLRITYDRVVTHAATFSYESVLELDGEYQKMLEELPLLGSSVNEAKLPEKSYLQRHIALIGTHSRIARLHRPYLSRGYSPGSRYTYSKERCLSSASIMVECHAKVKQVTSRGIFWFAYSHTLNAAMVLTLDLLWSIDNDVPIAQLVTKRKLLLKIQDIFSDYDNIGNQALREMVELTYHIMKGLLRECSIRQTTRMNALFNSEEGIVPEKPEPFAALLRRVSLAVQKERGESKAPLPTAIAGVARQMPLQPAVIGADNSSFQFLMNPLEQNLPMFAPSQQTYQVQQQRHQSGYPSANPLEPIADANSVSAANFAGLNGVDDLFEFGNNDRYNFNLWNFPTPQSTAQSAYHQDPSQEEYSHILRQLMGFEPSYSAS